MNAVIERRVFAVPLPIERVDGLAEQSGSRREASELDAAVQSDRTLITVLEASARGVPQQRFPSFVTVVLQLWDGDEGMESSFADVEELAVDCRFSDCSHTREPDCAVLRAVDDGALTLDRLRSYRKLERELHAMEIRKSIRLRQEETRKWRARSLAGRERAKWKRSGR